jgi:histidinol-phosphatase
VPPWGADGPVRARNSLTMSDDTSSTSAPDADLDVAHLALEWVAEAGELTLGYFRDNALEIETKGDGSPVTRADREAETLLRDRIIAEFPDDAVHGEEHDEQPGSSGRSWTIDPIDGTLAFSRGVGTYANLLQYADAHGPAIGIINLPATGECVWAARGHGAFLNDQHLPHRDRGDDSLDGRFLCISGFHGWDTSMFDRVRAAGVQLRTWGDAFGYTLVATGRADAMFDPNMEWWDLAAVQIVCSELGLALTRRDGHPEVTTPEHSAGYGYSAIASGGGSHPEWVSLLSAP